MATKGLKQPFWIAGDHVSVMTRVDGKRVAIFVAKDINDAAKRCDLENCRHQLDAYGGVDRGASFVRQAQLWGFPILPR